MSDTDHERSSAYDGSVPGRSRSSALLGPRASAAVAAALSVLGFLLLLVAVVFGPGGSEAAVEGGPVLIVWYGLPAVGTGAALIALLAALAPAHLRIAHPALAAAAACLFAFWLVPW